MLNAHMDTVGSGGMDGAHTPRIEGNRLHGRGSFDMKASLAAIMLVAVRAKDMGLRGDLILTAVADEEYASVGTPAIAAKHTADAAIVTEPTDLTLCLAHKGFVWADIEILGTAAHGSLPEAGVDAIAKMGRVLTGLEALDHRIRSKPRQPPVGTGSIHASLIEGGTELSTYPDRCLLRIERRTVPGETAADVEAELREILAAGGANDASFRAELRMGLVRDPFSIGEDAAIVQAVRNRATTLLKREPAVEGAGGWMDSALLSAAGIPTVIFGPLGAGAHADIEWVDLDHAATCVEVYTGAVKVFCGYGAGVAAAPAAPGGARC